nr:MAG: hypothetical protein 3 [Leviviridae sp.]
MRKYYSKKYLAHAGYNALKESDLHWRFLLALVRGYGIAGLGEDFFNKAIGIISNRSVEEYLNLGKLLPSGSQLYATPVDLFRKQYQVCAFLKKFPFSHSEFQNDRRQNGVNKFLSAEASCKLTNMRLRALTEIPRHILMAKELIRELLGPLDASLVMKIISEGEHGPGSTISNKGGRVTPYYKYMDLPYTVTKSALPYAFAAISSDPTWMEILERSGRRKEIPPFGAPLFQKQLMLLEQCVEVVESDVVTFVPKDARTERPIAVGSSLNIYLQLGVKAYMEMKLKEVGVDLTDQTKNQRLAKAGSEFCLLGEAVNPSQFSTIDLASASDTVSFELVKLLLPSDWFAFLSDLRHETGDLDGELISYEKFSAMGNGFTFPLESLIFWAVAKATIQSIGHSARSSDIAVYGDDIIVRQCVASSVINSLNWCGFEVNSEKSFIDGPFKESCGRDYLHGNDVRPFFLKREVKCHDDIYFICNSVARMCMSNGRDPGLFSLYSEAIETISRSARIYLPLEDNSDKGLTIPYSCLTGLGIRPYLSKHEASLLQHHKLLDVWNHVSQYSWQIYDKAKPYKGSDFVRLYTFFIGKNRQQRPPNPWSASVTSAGSITRRKSTVRIARIVPVLNWNGTYPHHKVIKHPFWDI